MDELLEHVAVGLLRVDGELRVRWANRAAGLILGLGPDVLSEGMSLVAALGGGGGGGGGGGLVGLDEEVRAQLASSGQAVLREVELSGPNRAGRIDLVMRRVRGEYLCTLIDRTKEAALEGETDRLRSQLTESESLRLKLASVQEELVEPTDVPRMIGTSIGLARVREQIARVAATSTTVLIQGETGSGKELVARTIHGESTRARKAFVAVNCASLPESLIESELFGHERGAFTGADRRRLGKFEVADGGSLFLDEIAELPLSAQAKLLRVLQDGTFERVGGAEQIHVDVRLIAATHRDLTRQVSRGLFREDLFYRLNVFRIEVPPLRERREDLRDLVEHLHVVVARRMARPVLPVSERSMRRVMAYRWPGNIRELANAVERATLLADGPELEIELPEAAIPDSGGSDRDGGGRGGAQTRDILLDLTLEQLQRLQIMHALETSGYRVFGASGAARKLEINPQTLLSRMDRYGIPRPRSVRRERG